MSTIDMRPTKPYDLSIGGHDKIMLDYQTKGFNQYGASMGRESDLDFDTKATLTVRHVALDGDYDAGGAYWGGPDNLFMVSDEEGHVRYLRGDAESVKAKFPKATFVAPVQEEPTACDLAEMLDAYITCALWASNDESDDNGGEPLDKNYTREDLSDETFAKMKADVETFAKANAADITVCFGEGRCSWSRAGHDLFLSRNGHGISFDDNWPEPHAKTLDTAARKMGETRLYVGDDERIHS